MAIKSDRWIRRMAQEHGMINPFNDRQVREGVISYGVSSYGYDLRVADGRGVLARRDETREVRHVHEQQSLDCVGDLAKARKVEDPRIRRGAGNDEFWAVLLREAQVATLKFLDMLANRQLIVLKIRSGP